MNNNKVETIGAIIIIAIVVATIIVVCSIYVPAKSEAFPEGAISFPSYWEYDTALVKNVQRALNAFNNKDERIQIDGKFGPKSSRATKRAQKALGLTPTGIVDDDLARRITVEDWPYGQGQTMYYMADHEAIYDLSDYEDMLYISLGGRSGTQHFSLFRDGILIAETDLEVKEPGKFPVGYLSFGELDRHGWLRYANIPDDLLDWLYANESEDITVVIDDRNFQPTSLGYENLIDDDTYADWD